MDSLKTKLDENIPRNVVSTREQAGRSLSYLESWYVIDRLNQVLGQGSWCYGIVTLKPVFEGKTTQRSGEVFTTSYVATVDLTAKIGNNEVHFIEVGYGDGTDKSNAGKSHELASKEAVSDGLKRAAKNLGRSMGLALYDKTESYINESSIESTKQVQNNDTGKHTPSSSSLPRKRSGEAGEKSVVKENPVLVTLRSTAAVLLAKKRLSIEDFKTKYTQGLTTQEMTEAQARDALKLVSKDHPDIIQL